MKIAGFASLAILVMMVLVLPVSSFAGPADIPRDVVTKVSTTQGPARIAVALNGVLRHPEERRVMDPWTLVTVIVTSRTAISRVSVTLNGAELPYKHERRPGGAVVVTAPVMLHQGSNPLVVSALDPSGKVQREESTLVFEAPAN